MTAGRIAVAALTLLGTLTGCGAGPTGSSPASVASVTPAPATVTGATPSMQPVRSVPPIPPIPPVQPVERPTPAYLDRTYRSPRSGPAWGRRAGTLRIPSRRIVAPVRAVGLDRGTMAIPDNPAVIGWLRTTATARDRIGAAVLSGHVSDARDVPGPLSRLRGIGPGAVIVWVDASGGRHRFVVSAVARYPRTEGVPARLFRVTGPHVVHLVTCTDRVRSAGGGFHYTANLVVTARESTG